MDCINKKLITAFVVVMGGLVSLDYLGNHYILGINDSASLPDKVFLVHKNDKEFKQGDTVAFLYNGEKYANYQDGKLFAKIATCMPGQLLQKQNDTFFCDGLEIAKAKQVDSKLNKLPVFEYNGTVPKDNYFFTTPHPKSFDSRYFGFVKKEQIIGVARSIF